MPSWKMAFTEIIDTLGTEGGLTEIVGQFVPWYAIVNKFVLKYIDIDITIFVASLLFLTLVARATSCALKSLERGLASWTPQKYRCGKATESITKF